MMSNKRIRVGVLFGGRSAEHEVSLQSARAVMAAMNRDRFEVIPIGVTQSGDWITLRDPLLSVDKPVQNTDGSPVALLPTPTHQDLMSLANEGGGARIDVILPLIHGTYGEDGTVQGLFELAGIPYVGSGVLGSAVAMDKAVMKALFSHYGLPVSPYRIVPRKRWQAEPGAVQSECGAELGYPMFVKPANLGSSVGISKVHEASEFTRAMDDAARYDRKLIVEASVENAHEIEIAVLGNDEPIASVAGEIIPCNEFYDYNAKYLDGTSQLIIPAPLPEAVVDRLQRLAIEAFHALECSGLARVDFLVRRDDHEIFLLEANTLPGFTPISMYPKLWQASGVSYSELIERLIELALERHQDQQQKHTRYG
jgi:D-alanine-D-alanine ligase